MPRESPSDGSIQMDTTSMAFQNSDIICWDGLRWSWTRGLPGLPSSLGSLSLFHIGGCIRRTDRAMIRWCASDNSTLRNNLSITTTIWIAKLQDTVTVSHARAPQRVHVSYVAFFHNHSDIDERKRERESTFKLQRNQNGMTRTKCSLWWISKNNASVWSHCFYSAFLLLTERHQPKRLALTDNQGRINYRYTWFITRSWRSRFRIINLILIRIARNPSTWRMGIRVSPV